MADIRIRNPATGKWEDVEGTGGAQHTFASAKEFELVNVAGGDQTVTINGGLAMAIYCDADGEVLTIDTTKQTNVTTPALQIGFNPIEVTKVYQTGTTIAGNVHLMAW